MKKLFCSILILLCVQAFAQEDIIIHELEIGVKDSIELRKAQEKWRNKLSKKEYEKIVFKINPNVGIKSTSHSSTEYQHLIGNLLPSFDFIDIEGNKLSLEKLIGKPVHINFWSVTCKPCIEEFPELTQLKEKYKDEVVFIAIAPEDEKKVMKILSKNPLSYQVVTGAKEYFEDLGINGYPVNFFINEVGVIVDVIEGSRYVIKIENGEKIMIPNNFDQYDQAIQSMN